MNLLDLFKNFDIGKGLKTIILGAVAYALTMIVKNPAIIVNLIPDHIANMTLTGLILEIITYILKVIEKMMEKKNENP